MIIDKLENAHKYPQIPLDALKKAISGLELGRHELSDSIYINVEEYTTKTENRFEIHKKYADIQILLEGKERLDYGYSKPAQYNEDRDFAFFDTDVVSSIVLDGTNFVMLFPEEAHRPQMAINSPAKVKKAVIKVKM